MMRLNKFLGNAGVSSRRGSEELISQGKIIVNGKVANDPAMDIGSDDVVEYLGKKVQLEDSFVYVLLNKPEGYTTTVKDPHANHTVMELVKDIRQRIFPVGRLDRDSCGMILLTNDGDLTYKMTHPKHNIGKTYLIHVKGLPTDEKIERLKNGIVLEGYKTRKCSIEFIKKDLKTSQLLVVLNEGRNRQVRKMFDSIGHKVIFLQRIAIGNINLGKLPLGKWRNLTEEEIAYLKEK